MPIKSLHTKPVPTPVPEPPQEPLPRKKSLYWWKIAGALAGTILIFVGIIGYRVLSAVNTTGNDNKRISVIQQLSHLVLNRDAQLKGESDDRVNILLLGIGGAGHDGPLLTDTMIVASIKPSTGQVSMLSIPRDLAVFIPGGYGIRKINSANAWGKEMNYQGGGEQLSVDIASKVIGQPIQYFARMDFAGFKDIVDSVGGITVNVEHTFADYQYPTENYGYQTIKFTAGSQQMGGDTALKYVRSRHGNNGEGSDFARSRRQQLVLEALKAKLLSAGTFVNAGKIGSVISSLGSHSRTNMEIWELLRVAKLVQNVNSSSIINRVIDSSLPNGFLKDASGIDGAYLLLPKDGSFRAVQTLAKDIFFQQSFVDEGAHIVIRDESGHAGTAQTVSAALESLGFPTPTIDHTATGVTDSISGIIDYSNGAKPNSMKGLQDYLGVTATSAASLNSYQYQTIPTYQNVANVNGKVTSSPGATDFMIIIGKDFITASTQLAATIYGTNINASLSNGSTTKNSNSNANTNTNTTKNSNKNVNKNANTNKNVNTSTNTNSNANTNSTTPANVNTSTNLNVNS